MMKSRLAITLTTSGHKVPRLLGMTGICGLSIPSSRDTKSYWLTATSPSSGVMNGSARNPKLPASGSASPCELASCVKARDRASRMSHGAQPSSSEHSCSEYCSRTDMTKANRSNFSSPSMAPASKCPPPALGTGLVCRACPREDKPAEGRGFNSRIAFRRIARFAQECAQSLNTWFSVTESSSPATKHCSAFS